MILWSKQHLWFNYSQLLVCLKTSFLYTFTDCELLHIFPRYAHDEEAADDQEETGWKYIHGDVFRYPKYKSLLASALGCGTQLFTL